MIISAIALGHVYSVLGLYFVLLIIMDNSPQNFAFVFLALALVSMNANSESQITIAPGFMNFEYVETADDGTFLDGEKGIIPGIRIELNVPMENQLNVGMVFEYFNGTVDYDGHLQSLEDPPDLNIDMLPFETETSETVISFSGYLSKQLSPTYPHLAFYGAFTIKAWERDIKGKFLSTTGNLGLPVNLYIPPLYELYEWWQLDFGLKYRLALSPKSYMSFSGGFLRTTDPTMEVSASRLSLQEKWGYNAGIAWMYNLSQQNRLGLGADYTYWEFGRSNVIIDPVLGPIAEPNSESNMSVVYLRYEHRF